MKNLREMFAADERGCHEFELGNVPIRLMRTSNRHGIDKETGTIVIRVVLKFGLLAAALAIGALASADARPGVISAETYACTSWGAAHTYMMQSLTPKGGQINRYCPIRIPKGTPVAVTNEFDDGYAVVTHRGKTWWVDNERVK
jgi:hypothetical protein